MKKKISKIMGIGIVLVLVASLMTFALPASADAYKSAFAPYSNTWTSYEPTPGVKGGWFFDPDITTVGPVAQSPVNGYLYAYVEGANGPTARPEGDIFVSKDGGRTWTTSPLPLVALATQGAAGRYGGDPVVDMVCSSLYENILYVTDGNYVYKSIDGGVSFSFIAAADLEKNLMGDCGTAIFGLPITSIDVAYDGGGEPIVFIGTKHYDDREYLPPHPDAPDKVVGSVYWIADEVFPSQWHDLQLKCFGDCCSPEFGLGDSNVGCFDVFAVGGAPGFANNNKAYAVISAPLTSIKFKSATATTVEIMAGPGGAQFDYDMSAVSNSTPSGSATNVDGASAATSADGG